MYKNKHPEVIFIRFAFQKIPLRIVESGSDLLSL